MTLQEATGGEHGHMNFTLVVEAKKTGSWSQPYGTIKYTKISHLRILISSTKTHEKNETTNVQNTFAITQIQVGVNILLQLDFLAWDPPSASLAENRGCLHGEILH